jgi:hypothetical protein
LESQTGAFSGIMVAHRFGELFRDLIYRRITRFCSFRRLEPAEPKRPSRSALTMLPTLLVTQLDRPCAPASARAASVRPTPVRPARLGQGVLLRSVLTSSDQDSSAADPAVAVARLRASVHVASMFVHCPDGDRGEPRSSSENHLRQRHLSHPVNRRQEPLARFAARGDTTIAARFCIATHWRCIATHFHSARWQRTLLLPPLPQGGPPNQERIRVHEERNVGQCLAARGVPHRHH